MDRYRMRVAGLVVAAALLAAGCGGGAEPETYSLEPTRACLEEAGLTVSGRNLDFVASTATGGALRVRLPANDVTISFGLTEEEASRTAQAYRRFAGSTIAIDHVLGRERNAVLVWGAPPADEEASRVVGCLAG
ncbi:MAG TPA: hypothetical protein VMQ65_00020 [Candidatus Limnocylindria bacterium]|nr:hypothetical protein [Candidatus Limnocylindria bacterium]